ncbi:hypothetical protein [Burkholderia multivorans]|uniref:hypothetical protein n=1 Tax=Burkholderia multivorans TaxID=87883 RepID=UPI0021BF6298|nr:hypothetical protein [Burkholderia multivorans]MDR9051736.1 hypothetical protein [Burkholderia multivorans]MDR9057726.1 hypothetical protein [Burkholderia multivorans]MDR9064637.1 hypothetical protein [Burkholderia multivorans]MDR9069752.1 hypothetical protein [Burkholderia multivorans]MDR9076832.1 hypothetical protein [Burkholderia multivorans]
MNEIKHPIGSWEVIKTTYGHGVYEKGWGFVAIHDESCHEHWNEGQARRRALITAAPDMAFVLEMLAADADAGTIMLTSGVRLAIDAALIKAGRKKAPEPVRHFTINGGV